MLSAEKTYCVTSLATHAVFDSCASQQAAPSAAEVESAQTIVKDQTVCPRVTCHACLNKPRDKRRLAFAHIYPYFRAWRLTCNVRSHLSFVVLVASGTPVLTPEFTKIHVLPASASSAVLRAVPTFWSKASLVKLLAVLPLRNQFLSWMPVLEGSPRESPRGMVPRGTAAAAVLGCRD